MLTSSMLSLAQNPDEARQEVLAVLNGDRAFDQTRLSEHLQKTGWEALSYIEDKKGADRNVLKEAVGDYYHFKDNIVVIKLRESGSQGYGFVAEVNYNLTEDLWIELIHQRTREVRDRWKIIYLDSNYLALDMGDLRVFFTHTPIQE